MLTQDLRDLREEDVIVDAAQWQPVVFVKQSSQGTDSARALSFAIGRVFGEVA